MPRESYEDASTPADQADRPGTPSASSGRARGRMTLDPPKYYPYAMVTGRIVVNLMLEGWSIGKMRARRGYERAHAPIQV